MGLKISEWNLLPRVRDVLKSGSIQLLPVVKSRVNNRLTPVSRDHPAHILDHYNDY